MFSWLKWLLAQVKAWFQVVMGVSDLESLQAHMDDPPISASLGPIDRLILRLQSLERFSKHTLPAGLIDADQIKCLREHLQGFRNPLENLSKMDDTSFRAKWWMKAVRELCYSTEDYLEEVMMQMQSGGGAYWGLGNLLRIATIFVHLIQCKLKCGRRPQLSQFMDRAADLKEMFPKCFDEENEAAISQKKVVEEEADAYPHKENKDCVETVPSKLLNQLAFDDDTQKQLKVVAISGSAGAGKTTLASTVYVKYKKKFQCWAFLRVSRNPDIRSLLTSILSQVKAPPPHIFPDVQGLIDCITQHLQGKRYFILIDDIRSPSVWHVISRAFPGGDFGSRIVVTTQSEQVEAGYSGYELEFAIFKVDALNDDCTDTISEEKNEVLNLRYNNLPHHLKTCLLYFSMYSEGCTIMKGELVKQWVAEGFIAALKRHRTNEISEVPQNKTEEISEAPQDQGQEIEEGPRYGRREFPEVRRNKREESAKVPQSETEKTARGYFDELVTRGMIQPVHRNHKGEVLSCTVHHMVLDLIRLKAKEENFIVAVDKFESTVGHPDIVRRLSIQFGSAKGASMPESIILSQVRSLVFCGFLGCVPSIAEYGLLRVLILNIWADKKEIFDLARIGELYHLIYLKIECNITVKLPSKIQRLRHLSTLQVDAILCAVPSGIVHLEKLWHLHLPSESVLPHGVGCMTSLRTLGYFDLGSNSEDNVRCLDELKNLQDLQLTCSTGEPSENLEKNMQLLLISVVQKLSILRSVTLAPGSGSCNRNTRPDYGAVSSMSISCDGFSSVSPAPAHHLQRLELSRRCCIFSSIPKWLGELAQLCILKIAVRELSKEDIDILKALHVLTALSLHVATTSAEMIVFGKGGFSVLRYFKFTCTVPWLKFEADAMPNLQKLRLGFNATMVDKQGIIIEHLSGIKEISAIIGCVGVGVGSAWRKAITNDPRNPKVQWMGSIYYGDQGTGHMVTQEYCRNQDMGSGENEIMNETDGIQEEGENNEDAARSGGLRNRPREGLSRPLMGQEVLVWFLMPMTVMGRLLTPIIPTVLVITVLGWLLSLIICSVPLKQHSKATSWDVGVAGWAITVLGWLLSPIVRSVLLKILSYLDFDESKLRELEIHITQELENTLQAVDQVRMLQRRRLSDVAMLDKMAARLRHAREDAEDSFDDAQQKIGGSDILYGVLQTCIARFNRSFMGKVSFHRSEDVLLVTTSTAASDGSIPVTTPSDLASDGPITVTTNAAVSDEPAVSVTAPSDSSGRWLSCRCIAFDFFRDCFRSTFYCIIHAIEVAHTYRNWSYDVLGITSYQENATTLDFVLTAISRRKLKKRIEKVENTISEVKKSPLMGMASNSTPNKNRSRIRTDSKRKVFGQVVLRDDIMARLREAPHGDAPSSITPPCYSVIGIYGVAGSGKTTFARYILDYIKGECKEENLFDTVMCIHLSETFSVDDIFHEMLKDITEDRHSDISDRKDLEEKLKESLSGKRFFLILDDIWVKTKNDPQLEELISPLNVGMKGSKILVTARTKTAARALCDDEPIEMPELDEDEYLSMFMHYTLSDTCVDDEEFIQVGRKIAKRLHRSPIAAVTVAGQLGTNPDISFWKNAAKLDILSDTNDALWWSYQQLNPDIKRCLEYCNIFPKRSKLKKDDLVRLWIAQGFVKTSCAGEDMEDVADGYIQELVSCSFLQPRDTYFTIHDMVHCLLGKVAGSDYFRIENERSQGGEGWTGDISRDVRHLFVQNYVEELIAEKILGLKNLRSLIIYVVEWDTIVEEKIIESICKRLPKLRVLAVAFSHEQCGGICELNKLSVPESISQLKHLRYLALRTQCTVILPGALTKLHHIQLLDFGDGEILEFAFAGLINLRHIICWRGGKFPNIGRLISLQTMAVFTVSNEQGYEVNQLRDLNKLRGDLEIYGLENVKSKEEALEANIAAKERLTKLRLEWGGDDDTRCSPEVEAVVLEGLCPPKGLETLEIKGYKGSRYPNWIVGKQNGGPDGLQNLFFFGCSQLGDGPELQAFLRLRLLSLSDCSWDALPGNMEHLTSLKILYIFSCVNIRLLPTLPQSLEEFNVCFCNDEFVENCHTVGHPNWHKIKHIPKKRFK